MGFRWRGEMTQDDTEGKDDGKTCRVTPDCDFTSQFIRVVRRFVPAADVKLTVKHDSRF
jgi:hypothetical protein